MASLTALTALGGITACDQTIGGIRITEVADTCLASLAVRRGRTTSFKRAVKKALGTDLPPPGRRIGTDARGMIWMGPDQYLAETAPGGTDLAGELGKAFGTTASITDQSDAWVRFDITGDDVPAMLERLSAADTRRMRADAAVRTPVHHMLCVLVCRDAGTSFTIYGPRASARSLHHALTAAAASI